MKDAKKEGGKEQVEVSGVLGICKVSMVEKKKKKKVETLHRQSDMREY